MKLASLVIGVLVIGLSVQFFPPAKGETFGPNVRVNADTNLDRNVPALAVGWDGTVYAAWQDKSSGNWRIMFAHAPGSGGGFTGNIQVSTPTVSNAIQQSPDIAYWNETVYVVWQESSMMGGDVIMFTSIHMPSGLPGMAWMVASHPVDGFCYAPSLAVGPNGTIYVAYSEDFLRIMVTSSYDGGLTWTGGAVVASSLGNTRGEQRLAVDPHGKVYVVWRDGRNGMIDRPGGVQVEDDDVYIANSTDGGRTFGQDSRINDQYAKKVQSSPSIAVDGNGRLHVAWKDERFEPNEGTDIFYAHSDDGKTFGTNTPVNDTSPIVMTPRRTTHQQPWIQVNPTGQYIYIAWVDDRSTNHNVYLAKSTDGGMTFMPAHEVDPGVGIFANFFIDDVSSYNGVRDAGEAAILDDGDGVLSPGLLSGSPDKVVEAGRANLVEDLVGDDLRYNDFDSNGAWGQGEDIVMSGGGNAELIRPGAFTSWDTTGQSITLLYFGDTIAMNVGPGMLLAVDTFDISAAGLAPTDSISNATLEIMYRAAGTYTGTDTVNWALQGGTNNTWFAPSSTGNLWTNASLNVYALGVTSLGDLMDMNVSFVNNGAGSVAVDRIRLNVTMGITGIFDTLDTIVYDGANPTLIGDTLRNLSSFDNIVFVDVDMTGRYTKGDPLIHTAVHVGSGGVLSPGDTVLARADGPRWRTLYNPFPVNDDAPGKNHFMPRIALNPFGYITAVWQDWRRSGGPDIYASTAQVPPTYGPQMAFYMETNQLKAGPGGEVAFVIWVRNVGEVAASMVNVTNVLPAGLEFIQSYPPANETVGQERLWTLNYVSTLGYRNIIVRARVNATIPYGTVLRTAATLDFKDIMLLPRPQMFAWLEFIASDLTQPTITHTPPGDSRTGETVAFTGHVTDDSGVAVVRLFVKPVGAAYFNAPVEDTTLPGGDFSISYNVGSKAGTLEYYIEAIDIYGNVAKSPAGAPSQTHSLNVIGGLDMPTIAVISGVILAVGVVLAVVFLLVMRKRNTHHPIEEESEEEPPRPL